jgi:glycosyltransferase involved in cell wall biosynthesis
MARHPRLDIQVAYCSLQGAAAGVDPGFGQEVKWDIPLLEGYPWTQVPNLSPRPGIERFWGLFNPGLWRLVRRGSFDAIVAHTGYMYASFWIAIAAARLRGIPFLFGTDATSLEAVDGKRWKLVVKRFLWPRVFRLADVVVAPSTATQDMMLGLGIPADRLVVTPFVVDNEWWIGQACRVDRAAVRAEWNIPMDVPVIAFCAKLQPWKRPLDVVRAVAKMEGSSVHIVYAGDGPLRATLEAEAIALGLAERVRFLGFRNQSQLPSVYVGADLLVLPSKYDPCPVVICEAMLCGCPAAISDQIRGRFDLVRHGDTGLIFPCGDVEAMAVAFQKLFQDGESLRRMRDNARRRMDTWSPRENIEGLLRALDRASTRRKYSSRKVPERTV